MIEKEKKKFSLASTGFLILVCLISLTCMLCILAGYVSPEKLWGLALFGLIFHFVYPVNLFLLVLCLIKRKKLFFFPFIPFVLGLFTIHGIYQFGFIDSKKSEEDSLSVKVLSFNVRLFDLYNWSNNMETRNNIFSFFSDESPDILCLQEFYSSDKEPLKNLDTLKNFLKAKNYHVVYPVTLHGSDHWGIATFSVFPIINKGVIYFGKRNGNVCIYTDIVAYNDTIRVFNTHLESIRFRKEDYRFILNLENANEDETMLGSKNILKRMRRAYIKRAKEAVLIDSAMQVSPYKHILCGDFNDPPASYTYAMLSKNMKDAFRESGNGFSATYIGPFPAYRIDYILHDKSIRSYNYKKSENKLSDHYPISCELSLH